MNFLHCLSLFCAALCVGWMDGSVRPAPLVTPVWLLQQTFHSTLVGLKGETCNRVHVVMCFLQVHIALLILMLHLMQLLWRRVKLKVDNWAPQHWDTWLLASQHLFLHLPRMKSPWQQKTVMWLPEDEGYSAGGSKDSDRLTNSTVYTWRTF